MSGGEECDIEDGMGSVGDGVGARKSESMQKDRRNIRSNEEIEIGGRGSV